jgi:hypothetical protein
MAFVMPSPHPTARASVAFILRYQDHRHRLRMDRRDHRVRRGRQKAVDEMRSGDRFRLSAPVAFELGPNALRRRTAAGPR